MSTCSSCSRKSADLRLQSASELLAEGERRGFARLVDEGYALTDWITQDYPDHCRHYFAKYVPGIFTGERNIIAGYAGDEMAGVIILKRDAEECKVCTLFVAEQFRGRGLATRLLESGFAWLGTTRPVITIADYKLGQFAGIIARYGWRESSVLERGFYNEHSREHVFNA